MDLARLVDGLARAPAWPGIACVRTWLASKPPPATPAPVRDDALFFLLARQLALDDSGAARLHVLVRDAGPLHWLERVSIPGTVVSVRSTFKPVRGLCYTFANAPMALLDKACISRVSLFAASADASSVFHLRTLANPPEAVLYLKWMQAVGACVHAALKRGELELVAEPAERAVDALVDAYRTMGAVAMDADAVLVLARELCVWKAADAVLRGGAVSELACGKDEVAWAARQLALFPAGDVARELAARVCYPAEQRFHAVYHDFVEHVDYNYVSVPLKAVQGLDLLPLRQLAPVDVFPYDARGEQSYEKRTMPIVLDLCASFPARVLVLRHFVDWVQARKDDPAQVVNRA